VLQALREDRSEAVTDDPWRQIIEQHIATNSAAAEFRSDVILGDLLRLTTFGQREKNRVARIFKELGFASEMRSEGKHGRFRVWVRRGERRKWPGGYIHRQKDGRDLYIIEKQVRGQRFSVSTRAHSLPAAMEHLRRWESDPAGYNPLGTPNDESTKIVFRKNPRETSKVTLDRDELEALLVAAVRRGVFQAIADYEEQDKAARDVAERGDPF
jgi:hypothetical protein